MAEAAVTLSTPIVERLVSCVSDSGVRHMRYLTRFEDNHATLRRKMSELRGHRGDVERRVEVDEGSHQMQRRDVVAQWLERVRLFESEVDAVLQECSREIGQRCCANYCPKNWWSRYKLGKKVCKKLEIVAKEISDGQFEGVAVKAPPSCVEVKNESLVVGMEKAFLEVSSWLENDAVKIIGIYGMGGVGKTTLLKKINNAFEKKEGHTFNLVIWVMISSQFSLESVQNQIGKRLGLKWSDDEDQNDKAQRILNVLLRKKFNFLLLLDDVWKSIDFEKIGIPLQNHQSKIVFTTRSKHVCGSMNANKNFKVPILEPQQAWELFQQKVGEDALNSHPEIRKLAGAVASECGGLPLALITIGSAMSIKMTVQEWIRDLETLKQYASEFSDLEENVLPILKLSYDNLNESARECFLYFSLYPEDCEISIYGIIRQWIGEGFLDKFKDMDAACNKGHAIMESLKAACLLESSTQGESFVKMHDVVRDLALWITSDCGRIQNKHLVQAGVGLFEAPGIEGWKDAERISLMHNDLKKLTGAPECHNLVTLLLQRNGYLSVIPDNFFCNMPSLRVLDLSKTSIEIVPKSIASLLQLQYINFEATGIRKLPEELGKLVNLKYLNLRATGVKNIPRGMVSCFPRMQLLDLGDTKLNDSLAAELNSLEQLRELGIKITEIPTHLSRRLTSCFTRLEIRECAGLTELSMFSSSLVKETRKLRIIGIRNCSELETFDINGLEGDAKVTGPLFTLEELHLWDLPKLRNICWVETAPHLHFKNLGTVDISSCPILKDISWLVLIPSLLLLDVCNCEELEEVIVGRFTTTIDRNQYIFSRLERLRLINLPELKSIVTAALLFPRLEQIIVRDCPRLEKLPLSSNSTNKSKLVIRGNTEWWNELQWEDECVDSSFQPFFEPIQERNQKMKKANQKIKKANKKYQE